jgi:hypothetical protein
MGIGLFGNTKVKPIQRRVLDKAFYASKRIIKFKAREFTERDLAYWKSYHISEKTLNFFCVKSVHKILNENSEVVWTVSSRTLTFAYVVFNKIKLYRPEEAPDFKWRNTCPGHYIQGLKIYDRKSNNDTLIITKSLKDVMVFYEFIGDRYDVIAPQRNLYFTETF